MYDASNFIKKGRGDKICVDMNCLWQTYAASS